MRYPIPIAFEPHYLKDAQALAISIDIVKTEIDFMYIVADIMRISSVGITNEVETHQYPSYSSGIHRTSYVKGRSHQSMNICADVFQSKFVVDLSKMEILDAENVSNACDIIKEISRIVACS